MSPRRRSCGTFLLLLAGLAADARADDPLAPPDLSRYLRWGPVHVRPGFAIPALGHDDNVFSASGQTEPVGDNLIRLSPRIEGVVLFGGATFLTFRERVDYIAYQHNSSLDYWESMGSVRVTVPFRRFGLYAETAHNRLKDPPVSELDTRPIRTERMLQAGTILELGWRTDLRVALTRSAWTVEDPDAGLIDGFTVSDLQNRVDVGTLIAARYRISGITRLTLDATNRTITFDNPDVERDSHERAVLPGVAIGEGGVLSGAFRIGQAKVNAKKPDAPDFSGLVGDATLVWRISGKTTATLDGGRRAGFAIYQANRYYESTFADLRGVHYLNRIFGFEAAAGRALLTFPGALPADDRTDHVRSYELAVRLRLSENDLGRKVEYRFGVGHRHRDSSDDNLDSSRNVVGFGAVVGF